MNKTKLKRRFKELYPKGSRLLAIQLNGFSHKAFYDAGTRESAVKCDEFSHCMPEGNWSGRVAELFKDISNAQYQGNAVELLYVLPSDR